MINYSALNGAEGCVAKWLLDDVAFSGIPNTIFGVEQIHDRA